MMSLSGREKALRDLYVDHQIRAEAERNGSKIIDWDIDASLEGGGGKAVDLYTIRKGEDGKRTLTLYFFKDDIPETDTLANRLREAVKMGVAGFDETFQKLRVHVIVNRHNETTLGAITRDIDLFLDIPNVCFELYDSEDPPATKLDYLKKTQFIYFSQEFPYEDLYTWAKYYLTADSFSVAAGEAR